MFKIFFAPIIGIISILTIHKATAQPITTIPFEVIDGKIVIEKKAKKKG